MKKTASAGGVVIGPRGRVLIVNQNNDSWSLPKGHIDPGEDALTAAKRETFEESGVSDLTLLRDLGNYQRYKLGRNGEDDLSELKTITLFLFTTDQEELQPQDPNNPEARWVDLLEVENFLTHPRDKEFFRSILPVVKRYLT